MGNLELWNKVAEVPGNAKKPINAGRLKGMTDINPVWRIKVLTEQFGICGIGWKSKITDKWLDAGASGVVTANVVCELSVKINNEWSEPIQGIGGSAFVANETKGLYTSDEAYKMAYTDALSVACKLLGIGANVYWAAGRSKYTSNNDNKPAQQTLKQPIKPVQSNNQVLKPKEQYVGKEGLEDIIKLYVEYKHRTKAQTIKYLEELAEAKYEDFKANNIQQGIDILYPYLTGKAQ